MNVCEIDFFLNVDICSHLQKCLLPAILQVGIVLTFPDIVCFQTILGRHRIQNHSYICYE